MIFLYMFRALSAHFQEDTLYTCSIWYCHSLWEFLVACRYAVWVRTESLKLWTDRPPRNVTVPYAACVQCILLKMSIYGSKHVEEYNILWTNNNQCIKLVINIQLRVTSVKIIANCAVCKYKWVKGVKVLIFWVTTSNVVENRLYWIALLQD